MASNVRVVCRFRPQNSREIAEGGKEIIQVSDDRMTVSLKSALNVGEDEKKFNFDKIFPPNTSQADVYNGK